MSNFFKSTWNAIAYSALVGSLLLGQSVHAQSMNSQLMNSENEQSNQSFFLRSPYLISSSGFNVVSFGSALVSFSVYVPPDAGEALRAVSVTPRQNTEAINLDPSNAWAYVDTGMEERNVALASIGGDQDPDDGSMTVAFDQPVQPGETVTVQFRIPSNPIYGGVYLLGVTAYPDEQGSLGLPLGNIRLHFLGGGG